MSQIPKRFGSLGWIEVNDIRKNDELVSCGPLYKGRSLLNLDEVARIHFPADQPGVVFLVYANGESESLEKENASRVQIAIEEAEIE